MTGSSKDSPPVARVDTVEESRFGIRLSDPYRWMETDGPELRSWLTAQADHTEAALNSLPNRARIRARVEELTSTGTSESGFVAGVDGLLFFLREDPQTTVPVLMVRTGAEPAEPSAGRVLADPVAVTGDAHGGIDWYVPSPDGSHVAVGFSAGGSEDSILRIVVVETGELLDDVVHSSLHGAVSWLPDGTALIYHRYPEPTPDFAADERRFDSQSCLHRLGTPAEQDVPVLARGRNDAVPLTERDRPFVLVQPDSDWVVAVVSHSALVGPLTERISDCSIYLAPRAALAEPASCPWRQVANPADDITAFAMRDDVLYLVAHGGTPRGRVVAVSAVDPELSRAPVLVPESDCVLIAVRVVGDYLLVRELHAGADRLRRVPLTGGDTQEIELPVAGTIQEITGLPSGSGALLLTTSHTAPPMLLHYDGATGTVRDTGWLPGSDTEVLMATDVVVRARDGAAVPLRLIHRAGLPLNGDNPTLLSGYGSYGHVLAAEFTPDLRVWCEDGGIYAVAGLRGGGEHGRAWHAAGRGPHKENTITDFIDCAEYLIAHGYTRPAWLAGEGASAGGIPVGGALVRRPELWAAMVLRVPVTNATRQEFSENGPVNVPEFGTITTEDGLRDLLIIDSYLRVRDGQQYPAVLLTTGLNDPRVAVWQPAKTTARLQAATASDRPVLLRVDAHAGHGAGATRAQRVDSITDILAFLRDQLGDRTLTRRGPAVE